MRRALVLVGALLLIAGGLVNQARPAEAATTKTLQYLSIGGDRFFNYDFLSKSSAATNVDWPVTVIFRNNATVDKAKSSMEAWSNYFDSTSYQMMYIVENDGSGAYWDQDGGKKTPACPTYGHSSPHYRVYGIGSYERMYSTTFGYYVPATTHRDYNECPAYQKKHADTEAVEDLLLREAGDNTTVYNDMYNFHNYEPYRVEGNHTWYSNGYASTVRIP
jgi:hypothetical protein